jgi:tetratricopeptide (TPR) repeat protein
MTAMSTAARAQYEAFLVRLHAEMRAGRGDEARANELRNEMAAVWYELGDDEHAACDELSEDLYIIEGKRAPVPLSEGETAVSVAQRLAAAFKAEENRRALELIRKLASIDARVTYAMGRCWQREGFFRAAVCFYDFANELEPTAAYEVMALAMLLRAGALDEAAARAQAIEERLIVSGTLLPSVASVLHSTAAKAEASQRRAIYERVTHLVEGAWEDRTALASVRAKGSLLPGSRTSISATRIARSALSSGPSRYTAPKERCARAASRSCMSIVRGRCGTSPTPRISVRG